MYPGHSHHLHAMTMDPTDTVTCMKVMDHVVDMDGLAGTIRERGWKRIGFQFPEGVKPHASAILAELRSRLHRTLPDPEVGVGPFEFILSGSPCYGACDPADGELLAAGAQGVVHFGHSVIPHLASDHVLPVIHVEMPSSISPLPVVDLALERGWLRGAVGLTTTIQHIHHAEEVAIHLREHGIEGVIGKGSGRVVHPGQVLGCSFSCATSIPDADMHLFIGEGTFHALGVALATRKTVIACDPRTGEARDMGPERDRILRQRFTVIEKLRGAPRVAVVLSTLPGQMRRELAASLLEKGTSLGKEMMLVAAPHLNPESLMNYRVEVMVSTACPRVAIDDFEMYLHRGITMATPVEFLIATGEMTWEEYVLDTIDGPP